MGQGGATDGERSGWAEAGHRLGYSWATNEALRACTHSTELLGYQLCWERAGRCRAAGSRRAQFIRDMYSLNCDSGYFEA